ncbi:MAG: hypothetical protein N3G22_04585 [Candidatus Micrarchaeota archaeon]|nr:hypothetical protein [Candidatus Micrarchaeota archaeon]
MADLLFCSHYPFTQQAKEYAAQHRLELSDSIVEKAEARLQDALASGRIKKAADLPSAQEEEIAIYAVARMVVSAANNRYLIRRYALAEAKRAGEYLSSDLSSHPEYVEAVAGELGLKFEKQQEGFLIPFAQYLLFTPRSVDYKLSNRELAAGKVRVGKQERIRILEEAVRKRIESSLPMKADFPQSISLAAARISALIPRLEAQAVRIGQENYPPCIRKLLEDLSLNINVPHTGRVVLAMYLVNAGLPDDKIVELFRPAPDFSEKTTRYQVEHIRKHKYRMPSCSTVDGYGLCVAECRCGNPMNYKESVHGRRLKELEKERKA